VTVPMVENEPNREGRTEEKSGASPDIWEALSTPLGPPGLRVARGTLALFTFRYQRQHNSATPNCSTMGFA
jgi:hypothetical protein